MPRWRMRRRSKQLVVVASWVAVLLAACRPWRGQPRERAELTAAERAAISAFSHGAISRESPVRVVFAEAVADVAKLNSALEVSPFRFEPALKGVAVWTTRNQIEFRPAERLRDGQHYAATLDVKKLTAGRVPLERFRFDFSAMRQSFETTLDGLAAADKRDVKKQ